MSGFTRRDMLRSALVGGAGLFIAFHVPRKAKAQRPPSAPPEPNAFLRIAPDDTVTVLLAHSEMGQGIWTTLAMLIAEELECDFGKVRCEHAPAAPAYAHKMFGMQATGGSTTTWTEWERYRTVGAMAREMLREAAAAHFGAKPDRVESGYFHHGEKKVSFGQLAEAAQKLKPPASPKLKEPAEWKIIGKPQRRLDTPEKITGKAIFGIDVKLEGLRTAVVARAPVMGATVKSFDASKAQAVPGVEKVIQIPSGVAVVASNFWSAKLGRDALQIDWDIPAAAEKDSAQIVADFHDLARTPGAVAVKEGDADGALAAAAKKLEAEYDVPYLAHACMEPMNATIKVENGAAEIWTGTQFQTFDQRATAKILGLPQEKVQVHTAFLGGGFGRRGSLRSDFVAECAEIVKATSLPVKTIWTREDDMHGGHYRPLFVHRIEVGLGADGLPSAWKHTLVGQSIMSGGAFEGMVRNGIDPTSVEGVADSPYLEGVPARLVTLHSPKAPAHVHFWRSVGHTHTAFAMESMIDELAKAAGKDPLEYRLAMLKGQSRMAAALKLAADKAGWGSAPPEGRARGLAVHESFGSIVAEVAEVSVEKKRIRVHKVTAAVDCGTPVNPLGIEAQVQGAVSYGLSAVLHSAITLEKGRVKQGNFHDYKVLRMFEMPEVSVHLISSGAKMGGIGEPATPPIGPAVANAVFALTGQRLRSLPLKIIA